MTETVIHHETEKKKTIRERLAYTPASEVVEVEHESKGESFKTYTYTPENPVSEIPVVISWGWATNNDTIAPFADMLAQEGRTVIVVDEAPNLTVETGEQAGESMFKRARKIGRTALSKIRKAGFEVDEEVSEINTEEPFKPTDRPYLNRNVDLIEQAIADMELEKVDIVTHSQGAILARLYAERQPDKIRSIVDTAPAGQHRCGSQLRQYIAASTEQSRMLRRLGKKSAYRDMSQQLRHILGNNKNAMGQQAEIAQSYEADSNLELRARGVKLGLLSYHADAFFRPQDLIDETTFDSGEGRWSKLGKYDSVSTFRRPMAGHNQMFVEPAETAAATAEILSSLNDEPMNLEVKNPELKEINKERRRVRIARFAARLLSKDRELTEADLPR